MILWADRGSFPYFPIEDYHIIAQALGKLFTIKPNDPHFPWTFERYTTCLTSRQLTVHWQPTMLKLHKDSSFTPPESQNCHLGMYPNRGPMGWWVIFAILSYGRLPYYRSGAWQALCHYYLGVKCLREKKKIFLRNHKSLKIFSKIFGPVKIYGVNIHQKSLEIFSKIFSEKKLKEP